MRQLQECFELGNWKLGSIVLRALLDQVIFLLEINVTVNPVVTFVLLDDIDEYTIYRVDERTEAIQAESACSFSQWYPLYDNFVSGSASAKRSDLNYGDVCAVGGRE
ncbi:hypothetical protein OO5_00593 [Enterococcus faecalis V583]|uniref:hypothetical protein n=1 Tax=Enterococcus faecalis TaxID=1351 RepID=UPI000335E7C2|nr:hypothetical protein [Enterococcus faecalis]EOT52003.1 hypothetical protein OO5_00593 [Enterococcus faecalis V583]